MSRKDQHEMKGNGYNTATAGVEVRMNKGFGNGSVDAQSSVSRLTYSVKESALALGVSVPTIWRMVYERQITATRVRGRVMIRVRDIESYLDANKLENL